MTYSATKTQGHNRGHRRQGSSHPKDSGGSVNGGSLDLVCRQVLATAQPGASDVVLSLGAASAIAVPLAEATKHVTAVDPSHPALETLRTECDRLGNTNVARLQGDIHKLEGPPRSVELIVSFFALHDLTERQKAAFVVSAGEWLRPGGRLVIADSSTGTAAARWWAPTPLLVRRGRRRETDRLVNPESLQQQLRLAGFTAIMRRQLLPNVCLVSARNPASNPNLLLLQRAYRCKAGLRTTPDR